MMLLRFRTIRISSSFLFSCLITYVGDEYDLSRSQDKDANEMNGIPALPNYKKSGVALKPATSGSSHEQSEDDELDGDIETAENMDPADAKRMRR